MNSEACQCPSCEQRMRERDDRWDKRHAADVRRIRADERAKVEAEVGAFLLAESVAMDEYAIGVTQSDLASAKRTLRSVASFVRSGVYRGESEEKPPIDRAKTP